MSRTISPQSPLYYQIEKLPQIDAAYYAEMLAIFPENSWFFPTNAGDDSYSICFHLSENHLIQRKTLPHWKDGKFYGVSHAFLYREDLIYAGGSEPF